MTQRGERRRLPTTHYLLPYERHAAAAKLRKQRDHPESKVSNSCKKDWALRALCFNAASNRDGILAALACLMTGGVLIASRANGPGLIVFYLLLFLGPCSLLLSSVRARQRKRAAREYQARGGHTSSNLG